MPFSRPPNHLRPESVELESRLANFDADLETDGWRAELVLRDRNDNIVALPAIATFEREDTRSARYRSEIRRSFFAASLVMPLAFDERGVARRVKLPLRSSLRSALGWSTASDVGSQLHRDDAASVRRWKPGRTFVTLDTNWLITTPDSGEFWVRVTVPGDGIYEAVAAVRIRPSVLVDTQRPYR
jgi:hypothetical protein